MIKTAVILVLLLLPLWLIYRILAHKKGTFQLKKELLLFTFFSYLIGVATLTVIPTHAMSRNKIPSGNINLIPVVNSVRRYYRYKNPAYNLEMHVFYLNFFGNIILFIPVGFLLPLLIKDITFRKVLLIAFVGSACIEMLQFISYTLHVYRYIDVDDVLLNVAGAAMGYGIYQLLYILFLRSSAGRNKKPG